MKKNINNKSEKRISIKELAIRLNISEQTYHNWKKDKPELIKLIRMGLDMENLIEKYNN
jgi:DNA-binding XRE family transcriptional regulator